MYDMLLKKKLNGENLDWKKVTAEDLEQLYNIEQRTNLEIAELFDTTVRAVREKRRKLGVLFTSVNSPNWKAFLEDIKKLELQSSCGEE